MSAAIPATMKAVLLTGNGGFDKLEWRDDVATPKPGAGEVLIAVGAAAINNTDINTRTGWYSSAVREGTTREGAASGLEEARAEDSAWTGAPLAFPRIQGIDACGTIVAVGAGVDAARLGERVLIDPAFRREGAGATSVIFFGSECDGAFADYAVAPATNAHKIVSALTDAELASFPCAYSAAENMIERAGLMAGETVLVTGASGGVGSAAVQLARRRGAKVVAIAQGAKRDALVLPREADLVRELGSQSVDVVVDVAGGAQFAALIDALKRGGRYAVAGAIAGPIVELDLREVYLKDLSLFGCTTLSANVFANILRYIERGEIKPLVAAVYPLRDIVAAQRAFLDKRHVGKIVLTPAG